MLIIFFICFGHSLAMILIYTLDLSSYTNPPPTPALAQDHLATRFHLFLDPASPRIELLPTSKNAAPGAKAEGGGKKGGEKSKDGDAGKAKPGEMLVVKRGWLGGWSVQPAQKDVGWAFKIKKRAQQGVQGWVMGWSSNTGGAPAV